jgi:ABC transporter/ABC-2 family transporter protein
MSLPADTVTATDPVVFISGLRKRYGDRDAVCGIDLEVRSGEIFAFLGPNGAGKTTTVEILEGFRQATGGVVEVLGYDAWRAPASWRARIGIVLQDSAAKPCLTVRECLELYAGYYPTPREVDDTLDLVDLVDLADQRASALVSANATSSRRRWPPDLLVVAKLLYGIGMTPGAIAATACTAALGALAFASIGYAVSGLVGTPDAAQPIVQATTLPLWFISGVLIPTQNLSSGLRLLGQIFPIEHLAAGLHLASIGTSFSSSISITDLLVVAAWGIAAAGFAAWRFSWLPSAATT